MTVPGNWSPAMTCCSSRTRPPTVDGPDSRGWSYRLLCRERRWKKDSVLELDTRTADALAIEVAPTGDSSVDDLGMRAHAADSAHIAGKYVLAEWHVVGDLSATMR